MPPRAVRRVWVSLRAEDGAFWDWRKLGLWQDNSLDGVKSLGARAIFFIALLLVLPLMDRTSEPETNLPCSQARELAGSRSRSKKAHVMRAREGEKESRVRAARIDRCVYMWREIYRRQSSHACVKPEDGRRDFSF